MSNTTSDMSEHPAANIETIVVDPDDVIETMRRNKRDETEKRTHVLRISPPFDGEKTASTHVSHPRGYPPEMDPKPLHFRPASLLVGHGAGSRHPDYRDEWNYPDRNTQKSLFRDEFDARGPDGENRELTEDEEEDWEKWWETAVEMWEDRVRHAVQKTEAVTLTSQHPNIEETTVDVQFETEN